MMLARSQEERPRALVIDNEPETIRDFIIAARRDWHLTITPSGKRGMHAALSSAIDVILLDTLLPDVDGYAVCRVLQESPVTRLVPVIFLTSANSPQDRIRGLTCGGVDYLEKTCAPEEILVRMWIQVRRRIQAALPAAEPVPRSYEQIVLQAAMKFIRANIDTSCALETVSREIGLHEKRLSQIFRDHTGMTAGLWTRREKLRRSMTLLAATGMSIHDIAKEVGYGSACNFTTAFRSWNGRTPLQFRKAAQDGSLNDQDERIAS
jgi:DNA-binding response OmpR family regulator